MDSIKFLVAPHRDYPFGCPKAFKEYGEKVTIIPIERPCIVEPPKHKTMEMLRYELGLAIADLYVIFTLYPQFRTLPEVDAILLEFADKVKGKVIGDIYDREMDLEIPELGHISDRDLIPLHARAQWLVIRGWEWSSICKCKNLANFAGVTEYRLCLAELEKCMNSPINMIFRNKRRKAAIMIERARRALDEAAQKRTSDEKSSPKERVG